MLFKRSVQRYGRTPIAETPYQRAGQVWDDRIGSARTQARNWRLAAFVSLGLTAGVSAGLVWQSLQSRVVRSEEHTSELPSLIGISYAVLCLKKKTKTTHNK